jgi:hypothetical protein
MSAYGANLELPVGGLQVVPGAAGVVTTIELLGLELPAPSVATTVNV